jgi:NAD(P)-dependent dehydrogenase (short-subunit alcohol dehydrogenase family)
LVRQKKYRTVTFQTRIKTENGMQMQGKVVMITGASSGIGKITALELARGGAEVIMVCRNQQKGEAAQTEIIKETGNPNVFLFQADLAKLSEVRLVAEAFSRQFAKLDVLINNAGMMPAKYKRTDEGFEICWATNYLSMFLLTNLLMDKLLAAGEARIINVSSEAHRLGQLDFHELHSPRKYSALTAYADSKLAAVIFTYELARRLELTKVTANCLHPGIVNTNFASDSFKAFKILMQLGQPFMRTSQKGAETTLYLATEPSLESVSGKYFKNCKPVRSSKITHDEALGRRLWLYSEQQTGLSF